MYSREQLSEQRIDALTQIIGDNLKLLKDSVYHPLEIALALENTASNIRIEYAGEYPRVADSGYQSEMSQ